MTLIIKGLTWTRLGQLVQAQSAWQPIWQADVDQMTNIGELEAQEPMVRMDLLVAQAALPELAELREPMGSQVGAQLAVPSSIPVTKDMMGPMEDLVEAAYTALGRLLAAEYSTLVMTSTMLRQMRRGSTRPTTEEVAEPRG